MSMFNSKPQRQRMRNKSDNGIMSLSIINHWSPIIADIIIIVVEIVFVHVFSTQFHNSNRPVSTNEKSLPKQAYKIQHKYHISSMHTSFPLSFVKFLRVFLPGFRWLAGNSNTSLCCQCHIRHRRLYPTGLFTGNYRNINNEVKYYDSADVWQRRR